MTSRTSTAKWKALRRRLMKRAIRNGTFRCATCDIPLDPEAPRCTERAAELDHIVPVAVAPEREFDPSNLVWLCHPHNRQKGSRSDGPRLPTTRKW